jgi:hypothetical protein
LNFKHHKAAWDRAPVGRLFTNGLSKGYFYDISCGVNKLVNKIRQDPVSKIFNPGVLAFGLIVCMQPAALADQIAMTPSAKIVTGTDKGSKFQLEVRQMPLARVLQEMTAKTGIPIHHSVLPDGVVTATCVGNSLKPVLECLLNRKADIIVRFSRRSAIHTHDEIAEAWVLGSKLEAAPISALCKSSAEKGSISLSSADDNTESKPDDTDHLLKIAQTGTPNDRAEAIGSLLSIGRPNDPRVKAMLEEAVHDQDANVRAQAVSTLTHRADYNESGAETIQEAMHDSSADVRMMAVDGITDDVGLLQQALNDSDEVIRSFAASKLEVLKTRNQTNIQD